MRVLFAALCVLSFSILKFKVFAHQRILGGQNAELGEFPWTAAIWVEGIYFCGGSLVSPFYVLTAAHCVHGYKNFHVIMGAQELFSTSEVTRQTRDTTLSIIHEDYNPTSYRNDVALIRLSLPFVLTRTMYSVKNPLLCRLLRHYALQYRERNTLLAKVICLARGLFAWVRTIRLPPFNQKDNTFDLRTATLTGWGLEQDEAPDLSKILQKLDLKMISNEYCASLFPNDTIGDIHLCTNTTKGQSPCRGDSGGALTVVNDDGERTQIGIDSFSWGACSEGYPEVFSRLSSFTRWIRKKTHFSIFGL